MRILVISALVGATALATPALAGKKEDCQLQADIVNRATELRLERTSQQKALEIMTSGDDAVAEKYLGAVPHLVDWIYSLKRKDLKLEPGKSYLDACLAQ